jgi:hypothetical protein
MHEIKHDGYRLMVWRDGERWQEPWRRAHARKAMAAFEAEYERWRADQPKA